MMGRVRVFQGGLGRTVMCTLVTGSCLQLGMSVIGVTERVLMMG